MKINRKERKKVKEDEAIICNLCKDYIELKKPFCEFIHFEEKHKIKSMAFYHIECFRERMSGGVKLKELQDKADNILSAIGKKVGVI